MVKNGKEISMFSGYEVTALILVVVAIAGVFLWKVGNRDDRQD